LTPAGSVPPEPLAEPDAAVEEVRYIRDVETLKVISDPTRMRMLETMAGRRSRPWSVKEMATALELPQTRLYHHVELLLGAGLILPVERRVVSGIIETRYLPTARSFQLDRGLFAPGEGAGVELLGQTLATVFDTARGEIERAIRLGAVDAAPDAPPDRRLLLSRGLARLTPARASELQARLLALSDEFNDDPDGSDPAASTYGVVLAVYPTHSPAENPDD